MSIKIMTTLIAVLIVFAGVVFQVSENYKNLSTEINQETLEEEVLSSEDNDDHSPETDDDENEDAVVDTQNQGVEIKIDNNPSDNDTTPDNQSILDAYVYPGSTVEDLSSDLIKLSSTDSPESITNWYKTIIEETGMNVKSFVTTTSNGVVLNKLAGASNDFEIQIQISEQNNSDKVQIEVIRK